MSTQISTPPPNTSRKQPKRQQLTYASDSGVQHQAKQPPQYAASDMNGVQHNTARNKREKKLRHQNPQTVNSPAPIPNSDGALSPRPSPAQARINHVQSPPLVMSTPMKQAYAGPTFHASPAASSLPKPKFFSKSVPSTTPSSSLQARFDADVNNEQSQTPSPESDGVLEPMPARPQQMPIAREESPLDLFFNAHRAEQARRDSPGTCKFTCSVLLNCCWWESLVSSPSCLSSKPQNSSASVYLTNTSTSESSRSSCPVNTKPL